MDMRMSYLLERKYMECSQDLDRNCEKLSYWKKLLGEQNFELLLKKNKNFAFYLNTADFKADLKSISDELFQYLTQDNESKMKLSCLESIREKIVFPEFYFKILLYYAEELNLRINNLKQYFDENIYKDFSIHLAGQLQNICTRTLIAQMHFYKQKGLLQGENSSDEYEFYCTQYLGKAEFYRELFDTYPVLYRCIVQKCEQLVEYYAEVLICYSCDRSEIQNEIFAGKAIGKITGIKGDFSDTHHGGKQVLRMQLDDTAEILYKPHSMENERVFYKLLDWLGAKTGIKQSAYSFIPKDTYSWSSCVEYCSCRTEQQLKDYYLRLGVQLFLAYALGTKDLHCENIIASGEYPVLIDLEVLMSIADQKGWETVRQEINGRLSDSVLFSGMLPFYHWNKNGEGINQSAVNGVGGQKYPFRVPVVVNEGTSDMRIEYQSPVSRNVQNLATLEGTFYEPYHYKKEMTEGFTRAYRQVINNKEDFFDQLKDSKDIKNRVLMADTQRYSMMISGSYHPSLLRDGAEREIFLYSMLSGREEQDMELVDIEVAAMLDGDIPYFYNVLSQKELFSEQKVIGQHDLPEEPIEFVHARIRALSEIDLEIQSEYIRLSLELMPDKNDGYMNRVYRVTDSMLMEQADKERVRYTAEDLTDRILKYAVWNQKRTEVSWYTVQLSSFGKMNWDIKPMNHYLYDGLSGMLLVFSELKKRNTDKNITDIYRTLKRMLFLYTDQGMKSLDGLDSHNTGAYDGESSIIYVYIMLYRQGGNEKFLKYAMKHAGIVEKLIDQDIRYDLLSGNAGAAWIMILLYEITKDSKYIHLAERSIARLDQRAERQSCGLGWIVEQGEMPMSGLAHGNSGILMPVIALWKYTKKERYRVLAEDIWKYEDSLYNSVMNNWEDLRSHKESEKVDRIGSVAWCHGAGGILLSRIFCYEMVEDDVWKKRIETDIRRAYSKLNGYWLRDSYCLCHGILGNLWILDIAGSKMDEFGMEPYTEREKEEQIIRKITLLPQERMNPGFMNGYGGILYRLLQSF